MQYNQQPQKIVYTNNGYLEQQPAATQNVPASQSVFMHTVPAPHLTVTQAPVPVQAVQLNTSQIDKLKAHGIAQVTMGSVGFLANIISSSVAYVGFTLPAFGIGFWGGIFLVVSGALAIVAANRTTPTRGLVMAFYIMDILAAVASGIWTLLAVIVISTDGFFYWVWLILLLVLIFCGLGGLISNIMSAIFIGKVMGGCSGMNNGAIGQPAQAYQVQSQPVVTYQSQPQPVMSHQLHADNRFNLSQQNQENSGQAIQNQSGSPPPYSKPHWQTTQQVPNQYHHQPNSTQQNSALAHSQTVPSAPPLASHQPIQPARQAPSRPIRLPSQSKQVMAAHGGRYEQPLPVIPGEQSHHYDALDLENQRYEGESGGAHDIKNGVEYDGGFDHGYLEPME